MSYSDAVKKNLVIEERCPICKQPSCVADKHCIIKDSDCIQFMVCLHSTCDDKEHGSIFDWIGFDACFNRDPLLIKPSRS